MQKMEFESNKLTWIDYEYAKMIRLFVVLLNFVKTFT